MSFLSIAFLAALPLAAAPLLLHFFDRRRNVVIEWGAMQFLEEAATRQTSARRLKEWLLLFMRTAALLALILALARPLLPGNWLGTADRSETIIVVDNSMSTMRLSNGQPFFGELVQHASETVNRLKAGDSVRVMVASPYPVWISAGSERVDAASKSRLIDQLESLDATEGSSDLLASLLTAVQSDAEATLQRRRIVLLTDGQGSDWKLDDISGWQQFQKVLMEASIPTELEVVNLEATASVGNLSVNDVRSNRTVIGIGQSVAFTAELQNHDRQPSPVGKLVWSIDGEQQHDRNLPAIDGGNSRDFLWKHSFDRTGVFDVSCQIDADDALAPDNTASIVVEVVERLPILLVEGSSQLAETQRDTFFVEAALGRIEGVEDTASWQAVFDPQTVSPRQLETIDLDVYRAVVVPNLTEFTEAAVDQLAEFVSDGGGLWIALGPRTDVDSFNHHFFDDGDGLAPLGVGAVIEESDAGGEQAKTKINPFGKSHPAVVSLADIERLDTGDVTVTGRFRFKVGISYDDVSVLLDLTNGEPLAVEKYVGRGRVIVQSIPLRYQWSDFALKQSFVVMVHDWLAYLAQPRATRHNLTPGDPISVHLADSQFTEATLMTPQGDAIEVASEPSGGGVVFRSSRTILPGKYALELSLSGDRIPFYVARDLHESNLTSLAAVDRQLLAETAGLSQNSVSRQLTGTNQRDPVWPLLLIGVIALLAGELLLSGLISRQRFGAEMIAETTEDWIQQASRSAIVDRQPADSAKAQQNDAGAIAKETAGV